MRYAALVLFTRSLKAERDAACANGNGNGNVNVNGSGNGSGNVSEIVAKKPNESKERKETNAKGVETK